MAALSGLPAFAFVAAAALVGPWPVEPVQPATFAGSPRANAAAAASPEPAASPESAASLTLGVWHADGHAVVCEIAWRELEPAAREAVAELLALDPDYDEIGPACSWPDVVRGQPEYERWTTAHYVNLPRGAAGLDLERDCGDNICAVEAIDIFAGRMRDTSLPAGTRLEALKFLGHFVGDIHQPLHAGYGDDQGGNLVHACVPGRDSTNLHAVWDGFIVDRRLAETGLDWRGYAERLHGAIRPVERARWRDLDPVVWTEESFELVETEVYAGAGESCFTAAWAATHAFTIERRLKQAGFRLGALLNDLLG